MIRGAELKPTGLPVAWYDSSWGESSALGYRLIIYPKDSESPSWKDEFGLWDGASRSWSFYPSRDAAKTEVERRVMVLETKTSDFERFQMTKEVRPHYEDYPPWLQAEWDVNIDAIEAVPDGHWFVMVPGLGVRSYAPGEVPDTIGREAFGKQQGSILMAVEPTSFDLTQIAVGDSVTFRCGGAELIGDVSINTGSPWLIWVGIVGYHECAGPELMSSYWTYTLQGEQYRPGDLKKPSPFDIVQVTRAGEVMWRSKDAPAEPVDPCEPLKFGTENDAVDNLLGAIESLEGGKRASLRRLYLVYNQLFECRIRAMQQ